MRSHVPSLRAGFASFPDSHTLCPRQVTSCARQLHPPTCTAWGLRQAADEIRTSQACSWENLSELMSRAISERNPKWDTLCQAPCWGPPRAFSCGILIPCLWGVYYPHLAHEKIQAFESIVLLLITKHKILEQPHPCLRASPFTSWCLLSTADVTTDHQKGERKAPHTL